MNAVAPQCTAVAACKASGVLNLCLARIRAAVSAIAISGATHSRFGNVESKPKYCSTKLSFSSRYGRTRDSVKVSVEVTAVLCDLSSHSKTSSAIST